MEHYVTLFDSVFLPQALALHASMQRHAGAHTLWMLCMDDAAHEAMTRLQLPDVRLLQLRDVETRELLRVKPGRTRGEYCWTITPHTPRMVFERDASAQRATYLDADLWFRRDPRPVFDAFERSGKSVLITEHAYTPGFDQSASSGRFCVQFMIFARDAGESVRQWWADRCIEWCFSRTEDGKFGDQMYLDDWPERFGEQVHVLQQAGLVQGPWNMERFEPEDAVTFHFHGLRLMKGGRVLLSESYPIYPDARARLYEPYLRDLRRAVESIEALGLSISPQNHRSLAGQHLRVFLKRAARAYRAVFDDGGARFGRLG